MRWSFTAVLGALFQFGPGLLAACTDGTASPRDAAPRIAVDGGAPVKASAGMRADGGRQHALPATSPDAATDGATPPTGVGVDLTLDGAVDSYLSLVACAGESGRLCLRVVPGSATDQSFEVMLPDPASAPASEHCATVNCQVGGFLRSLSAVGDHTGDGLAEVAVVYVRRLAEPGRFAPCLSVVDTAARLVLGTATSPPELQVYEGGYELRGDILFPRGPGGRVYPALTPGFGDSNTRAETRWGWGCLFRAGATSSRCGPGFLELDTQTALPLAQSTRTWFRELFGHTFDIDGDGYEDLQLPFHWGILSLSGATGAALTTTTFDVARSVDVTPGTFHSGRNYGTHRTFARGGEIQTLIVGGNPVGAHDDLFCNVSRFVARLGQPGSPSTRALSWSEYLGFHSNVWTSYPQIAPGAPAPTPSRWGDFTDQCIHRFSDSRTVMDGERVVLLNYFALDWSRPQNAALTDRCKDVQYQLYMPPTFSQPKVDAWSACARRFLAARGRWGIRVWRESDGQPLTGGQDVYVWGWSDRVHPSGEVIYFVESLPNLVRADLRDEAGQRLAPGSLSPLALVNGLFVRRGTLSARGRPALVDQEKKGSLGSGDSYPVKQLELEDRNGDGLMDIRLIDADGTATWFGYSAADDRWVERP